MGFCLTPPIEAVMYTLEAVEADWEKALTDLNIVEGRECSSKVEVGVKIVFAGPTWGTNCGDELRTN